MAHDREQVGGLNARGQPARRGERRDDEGQDRGRPVRGHQVARRSQVPRAVSIDGGEEAQQERGAQRVERVPPREQRAHPTDPARALTGEAHGARQG